VTQTQRRVAWSLWTICGFIAVFSLAGAGYFLIRGVAPVNAEEKTERTAPSTERPAAIPVEVVLPKKGEMDRTSSQPGSVQAFESVDLFAGVPGYLKKLNVDIGDRVKRGQVLALVDVPELEKKVQQFAATVVQANARVVQMNARVASAKADLEAAEAAVPQAEALARSKAHQLTFREKQLTRFRELLATKSIDERLVDEQIERRDEAREAEIAAREAVISARARVTATKAKIAQAEADVKEAEAEVKVAQAELEKEQVLVQFATITAPFDGFITKRNFFPNDYVRAASEGGGQPPLLTVQRTDLFRVVVQVPDRDVPYCKVGDPAVVEIDAIPGTKFPAKVARLSYSEDTETRLMHVEIDLANPTGLIRDGMYGRVTITLEKSKYLSVPPSCLVGKVKDGKGSVYVVRGGVAHLVPVQIGQDNGLRVAILSGLRADDRVILNPGNKIEDGVPVAASEVEIVPRNH
jgi:RND family efflux transporter MFP subunit